LVALKLIEVDMALVVVSDDSLPTLKRLAMLIRRAYAPIDEQARIKPEIARTYC
jgi:hypothetical protein